MVVRELFAKFGLKFDGAGLSKVQAGLLSVKNSALILSGALAGVGVGLFEMVHSAAEVGNELYKTSQKVGVSVEGLQRLRYAARLADVDQDAFNTSLIFFNRNLYEAKKGSKEASEAFRKLGIDPKTAKVGEESLQAIADKLSGLKDQSEKVNLLKAVFGRQGAQLIPFFNKGSKGIKELGDEIEKMGLITTDQAKASEAFNDELIKTKFQFSTLKNAIGIQFIPVFKDLLERFNNWLLLNRGIIKERFDFYLHQIINLFSRLAELASRVGDLFNKLSKAVGGTKNAIIVLGATAIGLALLFEWINPVVLLVQGLAAALLLVYDDYQGFKEGKNAFFDWAGIIQGVNDAFQQLSDIWAGIKILALALWDSFKQIIGALDYIGALEPFKWLIDAVKWMLKLNALTEDNRPMPWQDTNNRGLLADLGEKAKGGEQTTVIPRDQRVYDNPPSPREGGNLHEIEQPSRIGGGIFRKGFAERAQQAAQGLSATFDISGRDALNTNALRAIKETAQPQGGTSPSPERPSKTQNNSLVVNNKIEVKLDGGGDPERIGDEIGNKVREVMGDTWGDALKNLQPGTEY